MQLELGAKCPPGVGLRQAGDLARVFAVSTQVRTTFDKQPFDLRDRDLLHVQRAAVQTLEVAGPEGGYASRAASATRGP